VDHRRIDKPPGCRRAVAPRTCEEGASREFPAVGVVIFHQSNLGSAAIIGQELAGAA
jgi:hypothetical protein